MNNIVYKKHFQNRIEKLVSQRQNFSISLQFNYKLTLLHSFEIINSIEDELNEIAIMAVGGFARHELSPFSDCDLMIICENPEKNSELIGKIIANLWDRGLKISHTVRDIKQIDEIAENDLISFCQFLELRYLIGSKPLAIKALEKVNKILQSELNKKLLESILSDIDKRHSFSSFSPFLLEPNIKQNPGGLRDLQSAYWLNCVLTKKVEFIDSYESFYEVFLEKLLEENIISRLEFHSVAEAYQYILNLRNEMHIISGNKMDRLDFQLQLKVADNLSYLFRNVKDIRKTLMEKYFFSAEQIFNLLHLTKKRVMINLFSFEDDETFELGDNFILKGRFLSNTNDELTLEDILKAYVFRMNYSAFFTDKLRNKIIESLKKYEGLEVIELEVANLFRKILQNTDDLSDILKHMNRTGTLGVLIPEFDELKNFFQPNAYHIYTADEHTLVAIKNLSSLKFDDSILGDIYRKYENKEVLNIAILCHDIAKPHTLAGHEFVGAQICESIMERFGFDDSEIALASFLVKNHLLMEQVAFRRNIYDITTLDNFRMNFPSSIYLDFLYLLTYADLSAVNPSSWTSWKNSLLDELYTLTNKMIIENIDAESLLTNKAADFNLTNVKINEDDFLSHIESINDPHYIYTFDEKEISEHIREIREGKELSIFTKNENNFTKLTILTYDQKGLLANICGSIAISDVNIHSAKIFTRKDNLIIDTFNVCSFPDNHILTPEQVELLSENITLAIFHKMDLTAAFEEHKQKWRRLDKRMKTTNVLEIEFEEHPVYTIIDVHTSDRIGLLYTITKKITELELNIYFSKIGTKLNGVFDSFYVLDKTNRKVHRSQYSQIKEALTKAILEI